MRFNKIKRSHVAKLSAVFSVLFVCLFIFIEPALAQTAFQEVGTASGLGGTSVGIIIARIIRTVLGVLGIFAVILVIYAGWLYLTAQGEKDNVEKAKKLLKNAVIGLFLIFASFGITTFILSILINAAGFGGDSNAAAAYTEPFSGSLGAGILEDHYPGRNALEIPRNTKIFVTFKEEMLPSSIIDGYTDSTTTNLITSSVAIYPTDEGPSAALGSTEVAVYTDDPNFINFVFDPVALLGNSLEDTNYTVSLTPNIKRADGSSAFVGAYSNGYVWTFEVSTEVDMTAPTVALVIPPKLSEVARNATIEITFSEPMDPIAATGIYSSLPTENFENIEVFDGSGAKIAGQFSISNGYRTVDFTTDDACGVDPCNGIIYCLPGGQAISVEAHAASVDPLDPPQTSSLGIADGLVDAASNSLDGNANGMAEGKIGDGAPTPADPAYPDPAPDTPLPDTDDDYNWYFNTTNEVNTDVPHINAIDPGLIEGEVNQVNPVQITFDMLMKSSTLKTTSNLLWPDPWYESWWSIRKMDDIPSEETTMLIQHPIFVSNELGGWDYYPVVTQGVKSNYQICMYPAFGVSAGDSTNSECNGVSTTLPYCCNGNPSATPYSAMCTTTSGAIFDATCNGIPNPHSFCCGGRPSSIACTP